MKLYERLYIMLYAEFDNENQYRFDRWVDEKYGIKFIVVNTEFSIVDIEITDPRKHTFLLLKYTQ